LTDDAVAGDGLAEHDIVCVRARNPGLMTLTGTNTWIAGHDPAWVIDPGPALPEHLDAVLGAAQARGGIGGIALTHDHADHSEAIAELRDRAGGPPVAAARHPADVVLRDGTEFGPLTAMATPGHAPDHHAFAFGRVCFTGDSVLGEGSVIIAPDPGALSAYLAALERMLGTDFALLAPGHGPPVHDPRAKLEQYLAHRRERERKLVAALDRGVRESDELLDAAWADVPDVLRPAATVTLRTHLDKLAEEDRLPPDLELPELPERLPEA
jgi:glyoxylase-like metal-dependent hydrolase (beta-lactamase superfamily II)